MSTALALFDQLCAVGNALAAVRDTCEPLDDPRPGQACTDIWTQLTCVLLALDAAIDTLVRSAGLACDGGGGRCRD